MIDRLHSIVEEYSDPDTLKCTSKQEACDDLALGFLIRTFKRLKIYPEASQIVSQAIQEFKTLLDGVSFPSNTLSGGGGPPTYQCQCGRRRGQQGVYCNSCGGYTAATATSHATTCSPLLGYQGKIQNLIDSIEGLSYTDFVRVDTPAKENTVAPSPGANLWDCLEYN